MLFPLDFTIPSLLCHNSKFVIICHKLGPFMAMSICIYNADALQSICPLFIQYYKHYVTIRLHLYMYTEFRIADNDNHMLNNWPLLKQGKQFYLSIFVSMICIYYWLSHHIQLYNTWTCNNLIAIYFLAHRSHLI